MKVLITGSAGFTGYYLSELLAANAGNDLHLSDFVSGSSGKILKCDLTKKEAVEELIAKVQPERIYQLAGSFTNSFDLDYSANVLSTKNILDALLRFSLSSRVLLIGSCAEYGFINTGDNPVKENYPLRPVRIHGLTKVYQTFLMKYYCQVYKMNLVMARPFNLSGDNLRISKRLFIGRVCEQIEKLKNGEISKIDVGNLEAKRDYLDVRRAVEFYQKIMEYGKVGEVYNVGSGSCIKMRDLLKSLLKNSGLGMEVVQEAVLPAIDPSDVPEICADIRKIKELTS